MILHCNSCPSTGKNPWDGTTCKICGGMGSFEVEEIPLSRSLVLQSGPYTVVLTLDENNRITKTLWEKL